jgi:hypothetical protein
MFMQLQHVEREKLHKLLELRNMLQNAVYFYVPWVLCKKPSKQERNFVDIPYY